MLPSARTQSEPVVASSAQTLVYRRVLVAAAAAALFIAISVLLALYTGAFQNELSGESDEPAHYVTALMLRDYVVQGFPAAPMSFAAQFYLHYPKIGIGHWPPLFYVLQAGWMLIFGDAPSSSILLITVIAALLATLVYRTARREFGSEAAGIGLGALFLLIPIVQMYGRMIMSDMPVALFSFAAMLQWAEFMKTERRGAAVRFALLASAAILTKGNGYALALLPPIAIVVSRRWRLPLNRNLWLAGAIVAALTVPWNLITRDLIVPTMQQSFGIDFFLRGNLFYLRALLKMPGFAITLFSIAGVIWKVVIPARSSRVEPLWASAFAFVAASQIFHSLVPAGLEARYLLASYAVSLLFMAAGIQWTAGALARWMPRRAAIIVLSAAVAVVFFLTTFSIPRKRVYGFDEAARALLARPDLANARFLISSEGDGEGVFIAEIAKQDHRPGHIVARASQLLAQMGWNGENYRLLTDTPAAVDRTLAEIPADVVIVDRTPTSLDMPHHDLLLRTMREDRNWRLVGVYPARRMPSTVRGARIEVYRWSGAPRDPRAGLLHVQLEPYPKVVLGKSAE